jgi:hypothetical protein
MEKVMPLNEVLKYEDEMKKQGVSEVARSSRGFLGNYKKYKTFANMKNKNPPNENITWEDKRRAFVKRHLAQYKQNPTERRRLALIAWAFMP